MHSFDIAVQLSKMLENILQGIFLPIWINGSFSKLHLFFMLLFVFYAFMLFIQVYECNVFLQ